MNLVMAVLRKKQPCAAVYGGIGDLVFGGPDLDFRLDCTDSFPVCKQLNQCGPLLHGDLCPRLVDWYI